MMIKVKNAGFTLVEVLVVISIVGVIGLVLTQVFFRTIQGNNKAQISSNIKQNGQSALDIMDKTIRNSEKVVAVCTSANQNDTLVVYDSGVYSRFRFVPPKETATPVNGYIFEDQNGDCSAPTPPDSSVQLLTNRGLTNGVSVGKGGFSVSSQAGFKDVVEISFTVEASLGAPSQVANLVAPVSFDTSVELR